MTQRAADLQLFESASKSACTMTHSYQFIVQNWIIDRLQNDVTNVMPEYDVQWQWCLGRSGWVIHLAPSLRPQREHLKLCSNIVVWSPRPGLTAFHMQTENSAAVCLQSVKLSHWGSEKLDPSCNLRPNKLPMHSHGERIWSRPGFKKKV